LVLLGTEAYGELDGCNGQLLVLQVLYSNPSDGGTMQPGTEAAGSAAAGRAQPGAISQLAAAAARNGGNKSGAAAVADGVACGSPSSSIACGSWGIQRVARLRMPDAVTAVAAFNDSLLLVATKNVLALYQLQQERLVKAAYCFTRAPIVSLSPAPTGVEASSAGAGASSLGLVLASDMLMGAIAFQVMDMAVGAGLAGMGFCQTVIACLSTLSLHARPEPSGAEVVAWPAGVGVFHNVAGWCQQHKLQGQQGQVEASRASHHD
jgi:hypothetical protein